MAGDDRDRSGAWFVASGDRYRRKVGFWLFLASNLLWVIGGWHTRAYALIVRQLCLAVMNIRGERKNRSRAA